MGAKQLAIVLAPNILSSPGEVSTDPGKIVALHASCNQIVFKLISYYNNECVSIIIIIR
jgi:hypothetical protein